MYNRNRTRLRTQVAFLISLLLHLSIVLFVTLDFVQRRQPLPKREPIVTEAIKVELNTQLFHIAHYGEAISPSSAVMQRPAARASAANRASSATLADQVQRPIRMTSEPLGTAAQLPSASNAPFLDQSQKGWRAAERFVGEPTETLIDSPKALDVEVKRGFSEKKRAETGQAESGSGASAGDRDGQIGSALQAIAGGIAGGENVGPVDIVFVVDASGSMEDNIRAVARRLIDMVEIFQERELDFTLGVVKFKHSALVFPQTKDYQECKRLLENIVCGGDERAYDAIVKSISRVKFRPEARRRFILVTDEPFKGSYKIQDVIRRCQEAGITVDVIGVNHPLQKYFAVQTGGMWFPIPGG